MLQQIRERFSPPFEQAGTIRRFLKDSLRGQYPVKLSMTPKVFACLVGIPTEFLHDQFQILVLGDSEETQVMQIGDSETAFEAFRHWRQSNRPELSNKYLSGLYLSIYQVLQAAKEGKADEVIRGVPALFLGILEEDEERFKDLGKYIAGNGTLPDLDISELHIYLTDLWKRVPNEYKGAGGPLYGYSPDLVYG